MDRLSWLKRPFDPNLQYSFLYTFCGMLSVMFLERVIQLLLSNIDIPQAWGWYDLGTILGCLTAARMGPQVGEDSRHLLFLAGLLTLLLAGGLRVEWRERSLTEE